VATVAGLVSALAGDGLPDIVAWAALALPVLVAAWTVATRRG
jgi:uncharacterized membrane protein YjfL (UPF0719 family)